jgi:hypothetical protein
MPKNSRFSGTQAAGKGDSGGVRRFDCDPCKIDLLRSWERRRLA